MGVPLDRTAPLGVADSTLLYERLMSLTRAAVIVTAAAMPLYIVRFKVGPIPTTLLEILILTTIAIYAVAFLAGRAPLPTRTGFEIPVALLLVAGAAGVVVAADHRGALGIYRAYLVEPAALFYVATAVFRDPASFKPLLASVAGASILYSAVDLGYFLVAALSGRIVPGHVAAAFSLNPNYVAMYLEPLIGVATGFVLFGNGRQRVLAAVALLAMLPAEIATFSRGGLVVLALLVLIVVVSYRSRILQAATAIAAVVAGIVIWNLPVLGDRVRTVLQPEHGTVFNRLRIWTQTARMLGDHPLFGAGLNSYQQVMAPYRAGDPFSVPEPYPHNIALTSWTELGLLGLVAFAWILTKLIVTPFLALTRANGLERVVLWGTGTAFAMVAAHGLVDSPYWKNDLSVEFWLLAALQVVALRAIAARVPRGRSR